MLTTLTQLGFPLEACKRALFFTENKDLNDASNWLMEHISDSDLSHPFILPGTESNSGEKVLSLIIFMINSYHTVLIKIIFFRFFT